MTQLTKVIYLVAEGKCPPCFGRGGGGGVGGVGGMGNSVGGRGGGTGDTIAKNHWIRLMLFLLVVILVSCCTGVVIVRSCSCYNLVLIKCRNLTTWFVFQMDSREAVATAVGDQNFTTTALPDAINLMDDDDDYDNVIVVADAASDNSTDIEAALLQARLTVSCFDFA
jgi:hypothetical protein